MNRRDALIQLGKVVASEMGAGSLGDASRMAVEALDGIPDACAGLIDLASREARKKRPNERQVFAYMFMLGKALEALRFGTERASPVAAEALAAARSRVVTLVRSGEIDAGFLMLLSRQFATAKVDVGDEIRSLMGAAVEAGPEGAPDFADEAGLDFAELASTYGDDPFTIQSELFDSTCAFPDEHRIAIAEGLSRAPIPSVRDAALGWVFDPSRQVRIATAVVLAEASHDGLLTEATRRRFVLVRSWLPEADSPEFTAAGKAIQRPDIEPPAHAPDGLREVFVSGFDGAGAQSVFAVVKTGRKHSLVCLLLKQSVGLRDAWVRRNVSKAELKEFITAIEGEMDVYSASLDYIRLAVPHYLHLSRTSGVLPPFGMVDVAEMLGLHPEPMELTVDQITEQVLGGKSGFDVERALVESGGWPQRYQFMATWFEDDATVDALLGRPRLTWKKRVDLMLGRVLDERRGKWAERLAWLALVLSDSGEKDEAIEFSLVARELAGARPLAEIPLMHYVTAVTLEVWQARRA